MSNPPTVEELKRVYEKWRHIQNTIEGYPPDTPGWHESMYALGAWICFKWIQGCCGERRSPFSTSLDDVHSEQHGGDDEKPLF